MFTEPGDDDIEAQEAPETNGGQSVLDRGFENDTPDEDTEVQSNFTTSFASHPVSYQASVRGAFSLSVIGAVTDEAFLRGFVDTRSVSQLPTKTSRDLISWLAVSWVFSKRALFKTITKVAILKSKSLLKTLDLATLRRISGHIDQQGQKTLEEIFSGLDGLIVKLYVRMECSFECFSIPSGAPAKQMHPDSFLLLSLQALLPGIVL
ncbi:hypothetical protein HJFPF1_05163 [Paramyrothecium foliicola]|nr:hypothetical protein HJFPF1_05163 [Paramyrothecium foliicola]